MPIENPSGSAPRRILNLGRTRFTIWKWPYVNIKYWRKSLKRKHCSDSIRRCWDTIFKPHSIIFLNRNLSKCWTSTYDPRYAINALFIHSRSTGISLAKNNCPSSKAGTNFLPLPIVNEGSFLVMTDRPVLDMLVFKAAWPLDSAWGLLYKAGEEPVSERSQCPRPALWPRWNGGCQCE